MIWFALGKRGKEIRMIVQAPDLAIPRLNRQSGEVILQVAGPETRGTINRDGTGLDPTDVDWAAELSMIREHRAGLLSASDYTILPDSPFTPEQRQAWADYRTALRDITVDQPATRYQDIIWPAEPR